MKYNTVIFDFDSTLVTIEGIDELARFSNVYDQVAELTEKSMNGDIPFEEVFTNRLELIKPQQQDLDRLSLLYQDNLTSGAQKLIRELIRSNVDILVVTGGYQQAILPTTRLLGIPDSQVFAITLKHNGMAMTQVIQNQFLTHNQGKHDLIKSLDLKSPIAYVGDGTTDTLAKPLVDCFIGFGGVCYRSQVKDASDHYITSKDLYSVYNYLI